ncbi:MAG: synthase subunit [Phycisphaerales bacterium]|nr:synthase subunit [Phycisphaerales bacterium]
MNETLNLIIGSTAGLALGAVFFGGLWWTVRRGVVSGTPAVWFLVSLFLRMGIALGGIYLVARSNGPRLAACLIAFLAARGVITWVTRPAARMIHAS